MALTCADPVVGRRKHTTVLVGVGIAARCSERPIYWWPTSASKTAVW